MGRIEKLLRRYIRHAEFGWKELGERFTRYTLHKGRWFNVYLHQLDSPNWNTKYHNHSWDFLTILLRHGYMEMYSVNKTIYQKRRYPGQVMFRKAEFLHDVTTPFGTSWSLVITEKKRRDWGFEQPT